MSRRKAAPKRDILPDPLLGSQLVSKFINCLMQDGKKAVAESVVYRALFRVWEGEGSESVSEVESAQASGGSTSLTPQAKRAVIKFLEKALENVSPSVEVRSRRVGGSTYQVPVEVRPERRTALGMRWIIQFAKARSGGNRMEERLAAEIKDAMNSKGGAVKKCEDVYRMAKANQAFAHFRW